MSGHLVDPLLGELGVVHGFGMRDCAGPAAVRRPVQVHGTDVVAAEGRSGRPLGEADGVVADTPGLAVAIVTADCVPILLADPGARAVAAVHAGWRGLAAGVVESGVAALRARGAEPVSLRAAIGPHIRSRCYEVDEPVIAGLRARFGDGVEEALSPTRPHHALLDLAVLVVAELRRAGLSEQHIGMSVAACTRCDSGRFHSYRRDGARAGRMLHWIVAPQRP